MLALLVQRYYPPPPIPPALPANTNAKFYDPLILRASGALLLVVTSCLTIGAVCASDGYASAVAYTIVTCLAYAIDFWFYCEMTVVRLAVILFTFGQSLICCDPFQYCSLTALLGKLVARAAYQLYFMYAANYSWYDCCVWFLTEL